MSPAPDTNLQTQTQAGFNVDSAWQRLSQCSLLSAFILMVKSFYSVNYRVKHKRLSLAHKRQRCMPIASGLTLYN